MDRDWVYRAMALDLFGTALGITASSAYAYGVSGIVVWTCASAAVAVYCALMLSR